MKQIITQIAEIAIILSYIGLALLTPASILYCIYLWGGVGLPFSESLWEATKAWVIYGAAGFFTMLVSLASLEMTGSLKNRKLF